MRHNQNRRSRGRTNNRKGPNPLTRSYESNGPDVKVRGTAMHVAEKYMSLARDAVSSGDNVAAENYLQHAEHYNRIVAAAQAQLRIDQPQQFRDEEAEDEMAGRSRDRFGYYNDPDLDENGEERFDAVGGEEENDRPAPRPQPQEFRGQDNRPDNRGYQPRDGGQNRNDGGQNRDGQNRNDGQNRYNGDQPRRDNNRDNRGYQARPENANRNEYRGDNRNDGRGDNRSDNRGGDNRGGDNRPNRYNGDRPRGDYRETRGDEGGERVNGEYAQSGDTRPRRTETTPEPYTADAAAAQERDFRNGASDDMGDRGPADVETRGEAPVLPEASQEESTPRPRRRRAPRAAKPENPESGEGDVTPDGEAALAAFPD